MGDLLADLEARPVQEAVPGPLVAEQGRRQPTLFPMGQQPLAVGDGHQAIRGAVGEQDW